METRPAPWIAALRHSHDTLRALVEPLDAGRLQQPSYASDWSVSQVLSHLGSGSEIFDLLLDAALRGDDAPGRDSFGPVWDSWNARSPEAQATDAIAADAKLVGRFESLDAEQRRRLHLQVFGMDLDTAGLARMRLSEHAIHTWDVAVALDPTAKLAPDAVGLLVDTLDRMATRTGKPDGQPRRLHVSTSSPERHFALEVAETVTLVSFDGDESLPELRLAAEALVRLVYGRLDPAHTPLVESHEVDIDGLRRIFPGF